jgi:monofunctional biosynthetic peptidoglycan transglycosylase
MASTSDSSHVIRDFADSNESGQWVSVNDNVMGGVSQGTAQITDDHCLLFTGTISLENNGGFSSIRTLPGNFDLGAYDGIRIRALGDGRTYQFRLRVDRGFDGIAYKQEFRTEKDSWIEVYLPFSSFVPTFRGRIIRDAGPLNPTEIKQMGFLLADKTAGPFSLRVDWIKAIR